VSAGRSSGKQNIRWADVAVRDVAALLRLKDGAEATGTLWLCVELRQPDMARECLSQTALTDDERRAAMAEIAALHGLLDVGRLPEKQRDAASQRWRTTHAHA